MVVDDIDLACSEIDFSRLSRALSAIGIAHTVKEWHTQQAREDNLKVEFDSMEHWMVDLPDEYDTLLIDRRAFKVIC